ncbi:LuxR C-terminal-related transcriptional regulator [Nocardia sp. NBC_00511]|uniref:LuxR C-terminal-related transcriptional regulator n=1 Tax=Nocardia sp. NBC_00511 TaxID=2903591 RepID=UPI0030E39C9C
MSTAGQHDFPSAGPDRSTTPEQTPLVFPTLHRERLLRHLDEAAHRGGVILLSAPAGSGKSVLLNDWTDRLRSTDPALRVARLVPGDPVAAQHSWTALRHDLGLPPATGSRPAARLLDDLAASTARTMLVLEDAHRITDPGSLAELDHLVRHAPPTLTVVISTRKDLPPQWHDLEMRGRMRRFGPRELALTPAEVREVCAQHGCRLDARQLATVTALTQGWPALVRMAGRALAEYPDDHTTGLAVLALPPHPVSVFLSTEVLADLPAPQRRFLTRTAVPDAFTEQLADQLIGRPARPFLDELDRHHIPLARESRDGALWFTHHPQLLACLRTEARRLDETALTVLRLTTARWCTAVGRPLAALPHLLDVPGPGPRRMFLRDNALGLVLDGSGPALFAQLDRADPMLAVDPYIRLLRALDALSREENSTATAYLALAEQHSPHGVPEPSSCVPADWLRTMRRAVSVELAVHTGGRLDQSGPVENSTPTGNPDIDAYAAVQDAMLLLMRGASADGEQRLHRASTLAEPARHARLALRSTVRLAVVSAVEGRVAAMRERAQRALDIAAEHRLLDSHDALQAVVMTALAARMQGDDKGIQFFATELAGYARRGKFGPDSHEHVVTQLLAFDTATDRYAAAQGLRHSMSMLLHRSHPPLIQGLLVQAVWTLLRIPDSRPAAHLIEEARQVAGDLAAVTLCEAALAQAVNKARSALVLTGPLLVPAAGLNPMMTVLARLLEATSHAALGNSLKAYEAMATALSCAEPEHLIRPFVEVPAALDLLATFSGRFGHDDAFADRIRLHPAARRERECATAHPGLTTTELTVLKQLPSGRTTQQIADDLGVSINTVKTHMRGIYGKLGTSTRTEALDQARRTGLL